MTTRSIGRRSAKSSTSFRISSRLKERGSKSGLWEARPQADLPDVNRPVMAMTANVLSRRVSDA